MARRAARPRRSFASIAAGSMIAGLAAAVTALGGGAPAGATTTPGGVFITGHDPDFHIQAGNTAGARNVIQHAVSYVTGGKVSPTMLLVTDLTNPGPGYLDPRVGMTDAGYTFDIADYGSGAALDLNTVNFSNYDVVVVASDFGGWLRQRELDILNARSGDLINYVNGGGGLVAFSESGDTGSGLTTHDQFKFLPFIVATQNLDQLETGYTVTAFGATPLPNGLGLADSDVNNNYSHSIITNVGGMNAVDLDAHQNVMSAAVRGVCITPSGVPTASVSDVSMNEGNSGTTSFTFTVSLSLSAPCGATVNYSTGSGGTATSGTDYQPTSGVLSFAPGEMSKSFTVLVNGDTTFEPDETFEVNLTGSGVNIGDGQGIGTIQNDDAANGAPDCTSVHADTASLWPPDHTLRTVTLAGGTDPDNDPVALAITGVTQDEALNGTGDGDTSPDGVAGASANSVQLRAERAGKGDGRVYRLAVTGSDGKGGTCGTTVYVSVPHDRSGRPAVDSGATVDSFGP